MIVDLPAREQEGNLKVKRKWLSSKIPISWVHHLCRDQFPKLTLSPGHMRGNSWPVARWRAVIEEEEHICGVACLMWREGSVCTHKNI